jgi:rhodanese-related sulfurtransferase
MSQVESRLAELPARTAALVVCRSGGRSNTVTQLLNSHGIDTVNLAGGMRAWEQAGLPVVTDAGDAGCII